MCWKTFLVLLLDLIHHIIFHLSFFEISFSLKMIHIVRLIRKKESIINILLIYIFKFTKLNKKSNRIINCIKHTNVINNNWLNKRSLNLFRWKCLIINNFSFHVIVYWIKKYSFTRGTDQIKFFLRINFSPIFQKIHFQQLRNQILSFHLSIRALIA